MCGCRPTGQAADSVRPLLPRGWLWSACKQPLAARLPAAGSSRSCPSPPPFIYHTMLLRCASGTLHVSAIAHLLTGDRVVEAQSTSTVA